MATDKRNVIDSREAGYIDKIPLAKRLEEIFGTHDFRIKHKNEMWTFYTPDREVTLVELRPIMRRATTLS